jgi:hypothetical protein
MDFLLLALWLSTPLAESASDMEQLLRVVSYDRNLQARNPDGLRLAILHDGSTPPSRNDADRVLAEVEALRRAGSKFAPDAAETIRFSGETELYSALVAKKISALYITPGLASSLDQVIRAAENAGVITLSMTVTDVEHGLAVGLGEGRKVVVNIGAAERCGVDLDPVVRQVAQRVGMVSPDPERAHLTETLSGYRVAIENKDVEALKALWPGLTGQEAAKVKASMSAVRTHNVALALLRIEEEGGQLRVRVRRADRLVTREGEKLVSGRLMEIRFRRSEAGAWVIDSMAGV